MTVGYYILMFALGLVLLVWGSGLFVDSAVALANRFRLPEVLIGATIVSLGTTLPETLFSTMALEMLSAPSCATQVLSPELLYSFVRSCLTPGR